ncbi:MAG TPA: BON domain-containing protein [Thiobacillus sp.]
MKMKTTSQTLLNLTLATALAALSSATSVQAGIVAPTFHAYDSNGDSYISLEEFQAQGGLVKAFHEGDSNSDLRLSKGELAKASASNSRIMSGNFVDDAWITAKVKTMLLKDDITKGFSVNVETRKGTVLLSGWVDDEAQIVHAEQIARRIDGVKSIRNDLQINKH